MAHHVYTTEAFVIESSPTGEANKFYTIFTRDLGMIRATAQGVRLLKSKLRFSLQDFSYVRISVVKGKEVWRITSAKIEWNLFSMHKDRKDSMQVIAHVFMLLKRLIPGEEKNEQLFGILHDAFIFLSEHELDRDYVRAYEQIVVINILHSLGYMAQNADVQEFIGSRWTTELLILMNDRKKSMLNEINRALRETQL